MKVHEFLACLRQSVGGEALPDDFTFEIDGRGAQTARDFSAQITRVRLACELLQRRGYAIITTTAPNGTQTIRCRRRGRTLSQVEPPTSKPLPATPANPIP